MARSKEPTRCVSGEVIETCKWGLGLGFRPEDFRPIPVPTRFLENEGGRGADDGNRRLQQPPQPASLQRDFQPPAGRGIVSQQVQRSRQLAASPRAVGLHPPPTSLTIQQQVERSCVLGVGGEQVDYSDLLLVPTSGGGAANTSTTTASAPAIVGQSGATASSVWHGLMSDVVVSAVEDPLLHLQANEERSAVQYRAAKSPSPPALSDTSQFPGLPSASVGATASSDNTMTAHPAASSAAVTDVTHDSRPAQFTGACCVRVKADSSGSWSDILEFVGQFGTVLDTQHTTHDNGGLTGWLRFEAEDQADWLMSAVEDTAGDVNGAVFDRDVQPSN